MAYRLAAVVLSVALVSGCGGPSGVAMGSDGLPIAKSLQDDVKKKSTERLDRIEKRIDQMRENRTIRSDEHSTLKKICAMMKAGEWEKAEQLIDSCIELSQRGQ